MPVRLGSTYTKNIRVRWTDRVTGRRRSKAFRWRGPAEREQQWLVGMGHTDVVIETLNEVEAYRQKRLRYYKAQGYEQPEVRAAEDVDLTFGRAGAKELPRTGMRRAGKVSGTGHVGMGRKRKRSRP